MLSTIKDNFTVNFLEEWEIYLIAIVVSSELISAGDVFYMKAFLLNQV